VSLKVLAIPVVIYRGGMCVYNNDIWLSSRHYLKTLSPKK
jgi:hypothetical protein